MLTSPVLRALRTQLPDAEIHLVTKAKFASVSAHNPYIDKLFTFEKSITEVLPLLRHERYTFIADLHRNLRSLQLKLLLRTPSRAFPKLNVQKWLLTRFKINRMPDVHIVDRYFKAVTPLGVKNDGKGLEFFIAPDDEIQLSDLPVFLHQGYVAFAIGAQLATKRLPPDKLRDTCLRVKQPIVLLGGPEDAATGAMLAELDPTRIYNACGLFSLPQSASLVRQANVVLTHDTGLMHIAAAFGKKIISVWGNTVPEFGMYPYMPQHPDRFKIVEIKGLSCRPCSKIGYDKCPKGHFRCMRDISDESLAGLVEQGF